MPNDTPFRNKKNYKNIFLSIGHMRHMTLILPKMSYDGDFIGDIKEWRLFNWIWESDLYSSNFYLSICSFCVSFVFS